MQDRVLYDFFRQVNSNIDAQHKIFVSVPAEQALPLPHKRHLTQKSFGVTQLNRQGG